MKRLVTAGKRIDAETQKRCMKTLRAIRKAAPEGLPHQNDYICRLLEENSLVYRAAGPSGYGMAWYSVRG